MARTTTKNWFTWTPKSTDYDKRIGDLESGVKDTMKNQQASIDNISRSFDERLKAIENKFQPKPTEELTPKQVKKQQFKTKNAEIGKKIGNVATGVSNIASFIKGIMG